MKNVSLLQSAFKKYTSMFSESEEARKSFLENLSSLDLNKLYSGNNDTPSAKPKVDFASIENTSSSNSKSTLEVPKTTAAGNTDGSLTTLMGMADSKPIVLPNGDEIIVDPITGEITVSSDNPNKIVVRNKKDVAQLQNLAASAKKIINNASVTTEDIMSALSTLSTGDVVNTENEMVGDKDTENIAKVAPVDDTLIDSGYDMGEDSTPQPSISTASDISMPTDGNSDKTSASTGLDTSASSYMPTEKKDSLTGIDDSYVTETDEDKSKEKEVKENNPKSFAKDAGESNKQEMGNEEVAPEVGEKTVEVNPSGKDSAFWVPGDDLLGLKDIVKTISKDHGVPDAQETIGKDADGNLVKKPTTPSHTIPNMRQYVKTNKPPGMVGGNIGSSLRQPVDISDLDQVMGMDSKEDRALNISLNFNF